MICFAKRSWAALVLSLGETVTGLRDLLHTETFQWLGQLGGVSPDRFLPIWSIQNLLCTWKCGSWAAASLGLRALEQLTVADTKETWRLAKWRASFYRHLAFLLHLQQRLRIQPFKLHFLTAYHCTLIKIHISNTVKWSIASDSTGFWEPVYVKIALHTPSNPCHWHQLRTLYFIT